MSGVPASADTPSFAVYTAPTTTQAGPPMPRIAGLPPVGSIRSTTGTGSSASSPTGITVTSASPQTGAYTVQTATTQPSLPGVTMYGPKVLVPRQATRRGRRRAWCCRACSRVPSRRGRTSCSRRT